jgi:hypothetical protein
MGITWLLNMESKLSITTSHTNGYLASTTIPIHTLEHGGMVQALVAQKLVNVKHFTSFLMSDLINMVVIGKDT